MPDFSTLQPVGGTPAPTTPASTPTPAPAAGSSPTPTPPAPTPTSAPDFSTLKPVGAPPTPTPAPQKDALQQTSDLVGSIFPGGKLGEDIGTLGGYGIAQVKDFINRLKGTPTSYAAHYDLTAPSPLQATGDAANAALLAGGGLIGDTGAAAEEAAQGLGARAKLATAAKVAANVGTGATFGYASDIANRMAEGKPQDLTPGLGTVVGAALPLSTALVGALGKQVLAKTTGAGTDVLQRALDNPDAVSKAVDQYATTPDAKQSLVDKAKGAISSFLHQRSLQYGSALDSLQPLADTATSVIKPADAATAAFTDKVGQFGGTIKNGELQFNNTTLTSTDQSNLQQAWKTISNWSDTSVKGADNLRQAIGNLMDDFKLTGNTRANLILGDVKQQLTSHLSDNLPGYKDMLTNYGQQTSTAKNLLKELNLGGNAKPSTQLRQVMQIFRKDPSVTDNLVKVMGQKGADDFLNQVSGAILSEWFPPGVVGNAARALLEGGGAIAVGATHGVLPAAAAGAAGLAAASPRVIGTGATLLGKAAQSGLSRAAQKALTLMAAHFGSQ